MRALGFAALGVAVVSFVLWLIGWFCFMFLNSGMGQAARYFAQTCDFLGNFCEHTVLLLLCIGLIILGKKAISATE